MVIEILSKRWWKHKLVIKYSCNAKQCRYIDCNVDLFEQGHTFQFFIYLKRDKPASCMFLVLLKLGVRHRQLFTNYILCPCNFVYFTRELMVLLRFFWLTIRKVYRSISHQVTPRYMVFLQMFQPPILFNYVLFIQTFNGKTKTNFVLYFLMVRILHLTESSLKLHNFPLSYLR